MNFKNFFKYLINLPKYKVEVLPSESNVYIMIKYKIGIDGQWHESKRKELIGTPSQKDLERL